MAAASVAGAAFAIVPTMIPPRCRNVGIKGIALRPGVMSKAAAKAGNTGRKALPIVPPPPCANMT